MKKFMMMFLMLALFTGPVVAGAYDIREMTPEVKAALDARKARFAELKAYKAKGLVGENDRGYVECLGGGADVKALVADENVDRKALYQAIVAQNELGAAALSTVEGVFAGVQRDKAAAGEKFQDADGKWVTR